MRQSSPAALRNRGPLLEVLRRVLPAHGLVLEVASGTGEHAAFFAEHLPGLTFQPSDVDDDARASIDSWRGEGALPNLLPALALDATADADWPVAHADAVFSANMIHIAPWTACLGLLRHAARVLGPGAPLVMYGPYVRDDVVTAPTNEAFDLSLRARNAAWGLRHLTDVIAAAAERGLGFAELVEMPANNIVVVYRRR